MDFGRAFVSAIACNWMVCMGIWFYFGAKQTLWPYPSHMVPSDDFCAYWITTLCRQYVYYSCRDFFAGANVTWSQFFLQYDSCLF